jgi:phage RecT family recombinase
MTTENDNKAVAVKQAADIVTTYFEKFKEVPIAQALIAEGKGKLMDKIMASFYFLCRKNGAATVSTWDKGSVIEALTRCCQWELIPDGRQAALIAYKNNKKGIVELTFQPMYQGLIEVAYRTGLFQSIVANVVYKGDIFDHDTAGKAFVTHKKDLIGNRTERIAVYADVVLVNGGRLVEVMTMKEVNLIRNRAKKKEIWNEWEDSMYRKTPIKQVFKFVPKTEKLAELIAYDNSLEQTFEAKVIDTTKSENLNKLLSGVQTADTLAIEQGSNDLEVETRQVLSEATTQEVAETPLG